MRPTPQRDVAVVGTSNKTLEAPKCTIVAGVTLRWTGTLTVHEGSALKALFKFQNYGARLHVVKEAEVCK